MAIQESRKHDDCQHQLPRRIGYRWCPITALWLVPNYTAWRQRNMGVSNLLRVVAWRCAGVAHLLSTRVATREVKRWAHITYLKAGNCVSGSTSTAAKCRRSAVVSCLFSSFSCLFAYLWEFSIDVKRVNSIYATYGETPTRSVLTGRLID